ncbi:hypothetical protein FOA52_014276 [Chlamydomonas sp. UWO 241]|nr:hypothetical protein FOA52_014276 [Chlamydomonas sp. UWO 241]
MSQEASTTRVHCSHPLLCAQERRSRSTPSLEDDSAAFTEWRGQHPCILSHFSEFALSLKGKRLAVFLDYDGTLTPIVPNPEDAILSEEMRGVIRKLAHSFPTAIISGRGREKVENFVQLRELYYAGSHGMDIAGPPDLLQTERTRLGSSFQPAAHFRPMIDDVYNELCSRMSEIPGSSVEHNTFCVSAHFRNCAEDRWQAVVTAVEETLASRSEELCITRGRKVMEIRPRVNWHKGTALNHLLEELGLKAQPDVVAIYIGDDRTDEDAFKVLQQGRQGYGILVSNKVKETAASYTVRNPVEVMELLQGLVAWAATSDNGWVGSWRSAVSGSSSSSGGFGASAGAADAMDTELCPRSDAGGGGDGGPGGAAAQARWRAWQQEVQVQAGAGAVEELGS